tara:strand:+ start:55474 stop:56970 length:1497 start_codon:yes stop_codon:yes gene_type:complete
MTKPHVVELDTRSFSKEFRSKLWKTGLVDEEPEPEFRRTILSDEESEPENRRSIKVDVSNVKDLKAFIEKVGQAFTDLGPASIPSDEEDPTEGVTFTNVSKEQFLERFGKKAKDPWDDSVKELDPGGKEERKKFFIDLASMRNLQAIESALKKGDIPKSFLDMAWRGEARELNYLASYLLLYYRQKQQHQTPNENDDETEAVSLLTKIQYVTEGRAGEADLCEVFSLLDAVHDRFAPSLRKPVYDLGEVLHDLSEGRVPALFVKGRRVGDSDGVRETIDKLLVGFHNNKSFTDYYGVALDTEEKYNRAESFLEQMRDRFPEMSEQRRSIYDDVTYAAENTEMEESEMKETLGQRIKSSTKSSGRAAIRGGVMAGIHEAGEVILDLGKHVLGDVPMLDIMLDHPDGREALKAFTAYLVSVNSPMFAAFVPGVSATQLQQVADMVIENSTYELAKPRLAYIRESMLKLGEASKLLSAVATDDDGDPFVSVKDSIPNVTVG